MKISLALLMVMGILLYSALYLGLVYTLFRGQKIIGRAKAFVATFALWSFVWVPLWTVILFFSERQKVVIRPGVDEMLIPDAEPRSELARAVKKTSVSACNQLVQCEQTPAHANFHYILSKQKHCEDCLSRDMCPSSSSDGELTCIKASRGRCTSKCVQADMLERHAANGVCPNVVAYATAFPNRVKYLEDMCADDRGFCYYGCDAKPEGTVCRTGWVSYENETLGSKLEQVEANMGYPSIKECLRKHKHCAPKDCASEAIKPPPQHQGANCYCSTKYANVGSSPCARLESLCDRTSPQYMAAKALKGARAVESDVRNIDQLQIAADVRAADLRLSEALMF